MTDQDLPERVIGTVVLDGAARPFVFQPRTGLLSLDDHATPATSQADLAARHPDLSPAIRAAVGTDVDEIRIGLFHCSDCRKWLDPAKNAWSVGICMSCSLDRGSELRDYYHGHG